MAVTERDLAIPKVVLLASKTETAPETAPSGPQTGHVYVALEGGKQVFLAEGKILEEVKRTPLDLRDKGLVAFEIKDVKGIRLDWPDVTIAVEKDGDNWKLRERQAAEAESGKALDLLYCPSAGCVSRTSPARRQLLEELPRDPTKLKKEESKEEKSE